MRNISIKTKRNQKIKGLRKQGKTYRELSKKFRVSETRIGQICNPQKELPVFICEKHNQQYRKECPLCKIDNYYNKVLERNGDLSIQIEEIRKAGQKLDEVRKRKILVVKLHDEFSFSFRRIGHLLNRDHSSIIYLYYNFKKEKGRRKVIINK